MSFIKRLERIKNKCYHIWFEDNTEKKLYFVNPEDVTNKKYFDEIFYGTKKEALEYMRKQHDMMVDYGGWRSQYPYSNNSCSPCWDFNKKEYVCTPLDCPIRGSHKTDKQFVTARKYIKSKYEDRTLINILGGIYDNHYCRWYILKKGNEEIEKLLKKEGFEFYSDEEFEEYMLNFNPTLHIPTPPKNVICIETKKVYSSINIASKKTGICKGSISNVCKGKGNTAGGYHWMFLDDYCKKENN